VDESVQDRIGDGGFAHVVVPRVEGKLARDDGGAAAVSIFDNLQDVAAMSLAQRG
jgi:hypothetical protein